MAENLTIDINSLKEKGFITTVVDLNKLTKDNLSTYVTQVGVASKLLEMLSKDEDIPVVDDNDPVKDLKDAIANGSAYTVTNEISLPETLVINKPFTLTNNGSIVNSVAGTPAILVEAGGELTIDGTGSINGGQGGDNSALRVNKGGKCTIENGSFTVGGDAKGLGNSCIYVVGGELTINGGDFESQKPHKGIYYVVNVKNGVESNVLFSGGTFHNYNPTEHETETDKIIAIAEGYEVKDNGDNTYSVVKSA